MSHRFCLRSLRCASHCYFILASLLAAISFSTLSAEGQIIQSFQKVSALAGGLSESGAELEFFDDFGESIDSIGDVDGDGVIDLVVGAQRDDDGGLDRGAVYILFMNTDGTVRDSQKISDTQGNFTAELKDLDVFGIGASGLGDINGDGVVDIAVGAAGDDDAGPDAGAIYILFLNTAGEVISHQKITELQGGFSGNNIERLGTDLAQLDDRDGDGVGDLFVAQRGARFWIWNLNPDGTIKEDNDFRGVANFGSTAAVLGDLDGDGVDDIATGASADSDGGEGRGAAWILFMNADGTERSRVKISDTAGGFDGLLQDGDQFGQSVAPLGDLNDDGVPDLLVGAENGDSLDGIDSNTGELWILLLNPDGTVLSEELITSDSENFLRLTANSNLGQATAFVGDLNGDGIGDIVGAADGDRDGGGTMTGAFYVFFLNRPVIEPRNTGRFQQSDNSDNLLVVEAENFDFQLVPAGVHSWFFRELDPASNNGVMEAGPIISTTFDIDYASTSPQLDYRVNFVTSGTHYVWVRGFGSNGSRNSVHVGLNGNELASSRRIDRFETGTLNWSGEIQIGTDIIQRAIIDVPNAGEHRLNLWIREDGFQADKLILTTDPDFVPTGMGPSESQRAASPGDGNTAPVLTNPGSQVSLVNRFLDVQIAATDINDDTLEFSASNLPTGLSIDPTSGLVSGTPTALGDFNTTISASDGNSGTASVSIAWSVTADVVDNEAPILTNPGAQAGRVGNSVNLSLSAIDPDGDLLSYFAQSLPTGLVIDAAAGLISGTLIAEGAFTTQTRVEDSNGGVDIESFDWIVLPFNNPPQITNPGPQANLVGEITNLQFVASDIEGDELSFSATGLPSGLALNPQSGLVTGRLDLAGSFDVSVSVNDGISADVTALFNWLVDAGDPDNDPPEIVDPGAQTNSVTDQVTLALIASDDDGDAIDFSATGLPTGLAIDPSTGVISGQTLVPGDFTVLVTVGDGNGGLATVGFAWLVQSQDNTARFLQSTAAGNLLVVEAEHYSQNTPRGIHSWVASTANAASQGELVEATPDSGTNIPTTYAADSPRLDYAVSFVATGTHYVWVRGFGRGLGSDSVHVGLDGVDLLSSRRVDDFVLDTLDWSGDIQIAQGTLQRTTIEVNTVGAHELNLWMREDGFQVDKLFLTTDPNFVPTGFGPDESPITNPGGGTNSVPTLVDPGAQNNLVGDQVSLQLQAMDADGDSLTFSAIDLPDGLGLGEQDGLIVGEPTTVGSFTTEITVDDGNTGTASITVDWSIELGTGGNSLPVATNPGTQTSALGDQVSLQIVALDDDGDPLAFSALGLPNGLLIDPVSGLITGEMSVAGEFTVTVLVDDGNGVDVAIDFDWFVNAQDSIARFLQAVDPGNLLVIEAENFSQNTPQGAHRWDSSSLAGASQGNLMEATPEDRVNNSTNYAAQSPRLDFAVTFVTTGVHYVWVRGFSANTGADSVHVGFDGVDILSSRRIDSFARGELDWSGDIQVAPGTLQRATVDVTSVGPHEINVWMREDGFQIDKLLLTTDPDFVPISVGPNESSLSTPNGGGNNAPTLVDPGAQTSVIGDLINLQISAQDLDGDLLTFSVTGLPDGLLIDAASGVISGTLTSEGSFLPVVQAEDGNGGSAEVSFDWAVDALPPNNTPPTLTNPGPQSSTVGDVINLQVQASDTDGDDLAYSATGLPAGLVIGAATGLITGTTNVEGSFTALVRVEDGNGGSVEASFDWAVSTVPPANTPPAVTNPGAQTTLVGDPVSLQIQASDVDGDTLVFSATGLPTGLILGAQSGLITGTTTTAGVFSVMLSVGDGNTGVTNLLFSWEVVDPAINTAPEIVNPGNQTNFIGDNVSLVIVASDDDGDTLSYSATGLPVGLMIDASSGEISGAATAVGNFTVTVSISDGNSGSASASFDWLVQGLGGVDRFVQSTALGNLLVVEAENFSTNTSQGSHNWVRSDSAGASLGDLMQALPESRTNNATNYVTDSPRLDFAVSFVTTGIHYVWVRGLAINGGADSVHVGFDGIDLSSSRRVDDFARNTLDWSSDIQVAPGTLARATIDVTSLGEHTLNVWMREDSFQVDKLLLTTDPDFVPTGVGPAQSPLSGSGGGNSSPTIVDPANQTNDIGDSVSLQVVAMDTDGDPLVYSAIGLPMGLSIDADSGLIDGEPTLAGQFNPMITVADNNGGSTMASFAWLIEDLPSSTGRFLQSNGVGNFLVIEAESFTTNSSQGVHNWLADATAGAAAGAAMASLPNSGTNNSTNYVTQSPRLDYEVTFVVPGTHYVWLRGFSPNRGADSVHVGLDGADLESTRRFGGFAIRSFDWSGDIQVTGGALQRATLDIPAAGDYVLNIWMREDGFIADKLLVTTDSNFVPNGIGPEESPR